VGQEDYLRSTDILTAPAPQANEFTEALEGPTTLKHSEEARLASFLGFGQGRFARPKSCYGKRWTFWDIQRHVLGPEPRDTKVSMEYLI
jgi:hypothetical protein